MFVVRWMEKSSSSIHMFSGWPFHFELYLCIFSSEWVECLFSSDGSTPRIGCPGRRMSSLLTLDYWSHWTSEDPGQLVVTLDYSQTHLLTWKTSLQDTRHVLTVECGLIQSVWPTYLSQGTPYQTTGHKNPTIYQYLLTLFCYYDSIYVTLPPRFFPPLLKTSYQRHLYGMLSKPYSCVVFAQNSAFYVSLHAFQNNCKLFCSIEIVNLIFEMDISIWERSSLNQICCFKSSWLSIEYWLKIQFFH